MPRSSTRCGSAYRGRQFPSKNASTVAVNVPALLPDSGTCVPFGTTHGYDAGTAWWMSQAIEAGKQ